MPDITVSIPTPVLVGTQKFRVRYSNNNGSTWTTVAPDRTNVPFTITGLTPGNYLLEFRLVLEDGTLCQAAYKNFTVILDFDCWEFETVLEYIGDQFYIQVDYTFGGTSPACGWIIEYNIVGGSTTTVPYSSLPTSPFLIPVTNNDYDVRIYANHCNGDRQLCHTATMTPVQPCAPFVILSAHIGVFIPGPSYVTVGYVNSIPSTNPVQVIWHQVGTPLSGVLDPGGASMVVPTLGSPGPGGGIALQVNPNLKMLGNLISYEVKLIDICGDEHIVTVSQAI